MKIETLEKFIKITVEDGMFLTSYKDGDDILTYSSCRIMITPLTADLNNVREITETENNTYMELLEEETNKREKNY